MKYFKFVYATSTDNANLHSRICCVNDSTSILMMSWFCISSS